MRWLDCHEIRNNPYWNIFLLALAWSWTLTTSTLLTTIGPLSAQILGASDSLAAFTIGIFLFGAAFSSVPSAILFQSFGRIGGFSIGCAAQVVGSILGAAAMRLDNIFLLYVGCFSIGLGQGLGQFYRFAAVETCPADLKARAVTYVLSGGVIAAFLGPNLADRSQHFTARDYLGSFGIMAVIGILNEFTILLVRFPKQPSSEGTIQQSNTSKIDQPSQLQSAMARSVWEIITQPLFMVSCAVATLAHTIMVMLMSNVTLAMKSHDYSMGSTSIVMELHFFAMFVPGFFTGIFIKNYGTFVVALTGAILLAASILVLAIDTDLWNYVLGMILVGAGWNFSFSSGTVMLTTSYEPSEATRIQAVNDVILFSVSGAGSLLSGVIFSYGGWLCLIFVVSGLTVVYLALFILAWGLRSAIAKADRATIVELESHSQLHDYGSKDTSFTPNNLCNTSGASITVRIKSAISSGMNDTTDAEFGLRGSEMTEIEQSGEIKSEAISSGIPAQFSDRFNLRQLSSVSQSNSPRFTISSRTSRVSLDSRRSFSVTYDSSKLFQPDPSHPHEHDISVRTMSVT